MIIVFFLEKDIPKDRINSIESLLQSSPLIDDHHFKSAEKALENFLNNFPDLERVIENLESNPLPPSIEATLKNDILYSDDLTLFIDKMKNTEGIKEVQFNQEWVNKMESFSKLAKAIGFFLGGILSLASLFIISNVVKLNVMARKDEIEILRLIGATNTYIRIPFLLEGIILGILGGGISLVLLLILIKLFPVYLGKSLGAFNELINFRYLSFSQCFSLIIGGAIIGFFGSFTSITQFLKT